MQKVYNHGEGYCLVLSGGGAKGVYHIGVWKALKELGIGVDAFIGNSIGAILAGFMVQNLDDVLEEIGTKIGLDFVVNVPKRFIEKGELKIPRCKLSAFRSFYSSIISRKGGLDTTPLRNLLNTYLDEEKIRSSGYDLGVVTINISDLRPQYVFLEDMEPGTVIDYLMASSAVPGFESPIIGGKKYMDGALFNNIPYSMARDRGYKKIIVVDISGAGISRRPHIEGSDTVYIKNSLDMGSIFDFDRDFLDNYNTLGYLDTMQAFGEYKGSNYFILPDTSRETAFEKTVGSDVGVKTLARFVSDNDPKGRKEKKLDVESSLGERKRAIRHILPKKNSSERELLYPLLDCAALSFQMERVYAYTIDELFETLLRKKDKEDKRISELKEQFESSTLRKLPKKIKTIFISARDIHFTKETPYFYFRLVENVIGKRLPRLLKKPYLRVYARVNSANLVLKLLKNFK